VPKSKIE